MSGVTSVDWEALAVQMSGLADFGARMAATLELASVLEMDHALALQWADLRGGMVEAAGGMKEGADMLRADSAVMGVLLGNDVLTAREVKVAVCTTAAVLALMVEALAENLCR